MTQIDPEALQAENAELRATIATLRRVIGYLRADNAALGQRRATIRREAERDLMNALGQ